MGFGRCHGLRLFFALGAISLGVLVSYAPTFTGAFLLDDHKLIENNPFLEELKPFHRYLFLEDGVDRSQWDEGYHTGYYRPLVSLSYALDRKLWGNQPAGYRATNLMLHLATCLVLLALVRRHVTTTWAGTAAVLCFALHPVNTEAVAWISSRNNIMAALFSLLALFTYASRGKPGMASIFLAPCCFGLALFSKEFGAMLLPILFVWNRTVQAGKRSFTVEAAGYLPFAAVLLVYVALRTMVIGTPLSPHGVGGAVSRMALAPFLVLFNLRLLLIPAGLHSFSVSYPQDEAAVRAVASGVAGLLLFGWLLWRLRREKEIVLGITAFLLGLFPVLNIIPFSAVSLIAMRWLYFPAVFIPIALARPIAWLLRHRSGMWGTAAVLAGLAASTFYLNQVHWHDEPAFYRREVVRFGNAAYAGDFAEVLHGKGDLGTAERFYLEGLAARPDLVENHINYAALLIDTGRSEHALAVLDRIDGRAMSRENRGRLNNNRAMALSRLGRHPQALAGFRKAVALAPQEAVFWGNLASAHGMAGEYDLAEENLEKGLALNPESVALLVSLAWTRVHQNDFSGADAAFSRLPDQVRAKRADLAARIRFGLEAVSRELRP